MPKNFLNFCTHESKVRRRGTTCIFGALLIVLSVISGCSSYFRTGEMSAEELEQRQRERRQEQERFIEPKPKFFDD